MEAFLQVGVISSTHGVRGEVKVFPTTNEKERFLDLDSVILDTGKERLTLEIEGVKFFKQFAILKFKGFDNINDIEKYKGKSLWIPREQAVPLSEDEYYIADLLGMDVVLEDGTDRKAACIGGMLTMMNGECRLIPTTWEWSEDIDVARAEKAKKLAEEKLNQSSMDDKEVKLAEAKLHRALVRIGTAQK